MHIVVDGTPAVRDIRAIKRYTHHLIVELGKTRGGERFSFFYLGRGIRRSERPPVDDPTAAEVLVNVPGRILLPFMNRLGFPKLERFLGGPCDLVHFPGGWPYVPCRAPVVVTTVHGFHHLKVPEYMSSSWCRTLDRMYRTAVGRSTHFITVSETNKRELIEFYGVPEDRVRAVPLGVSPEFRNRKGEGDFLREARHRLGLGESRRALFVGALEPHKNVANIVEAFALFLSRTGDPWELILVGKRGSYAARISRLAAELGVEERVRFFDYLPPGSTALADLYNLADVFLFPTLYEGWASPPLEAMISGTPVVASDIPSLRESTGGCALYVDPRRAEEIARALEELASEEKLRRELSRRGEEFASRFTWKRCAAETLAYYRFLLGGGSSIPPT